MTSGLVVDSIIVDFVGLRALDEISLAVHPGEILGLIGPNGSGKTTLINAITGYVETQGGTVVVDGQEITGLPPHQVARHGVRRTFQTIRLFKSLSVLENIEVAGVSSGLNRRESRRLAAEIMERLGIAQLAEVSAGALPYGEERRVEIARALVTRPHYLLLDEPAAGLNEQESDNLLNTLPGIIREHECSVLIIDHDMRLIMRMCDRLHVLNYGRTIGEGTPREVRRNPEVIAAYLGAGHEAGKQARRAAGRNEGNTHAPGE
jgi:branched-chain amino acid transport system ATP-binding protein